VQKSNLIDSRRTGIYLLTIQTLAGLAQWIDIFLIFTVPSFLWKSSPAEIAFLASCFALPGLFFGPLIGALLDRVNPRKMMMIGALARTTLTLMIAFAPAFPSFTCLVLLKGLANLLYWPASTVVTNQVISEVQRVKYFSSQSALDQLSKIGTPLLAGILALATTAQLTFLVSAMLMLACATMLVFIGDTTSQPTQKRSINGILQDLLEGFRAIKSLHKNLLASISLSIGLSLGLAIYDPHLAAFLSARGFDVGVFSMLVSATGAGAVAGASLVRIRLNAASPVTLMRIGIATFTLAISGTAIMLSLASELLGPVTLIFLWFLNGMGYEVFVIGSSVNLQNLCPPALLGRISTSVRSLQMSTIVFGPSIGAWLVTSYSRDAPFIIASIVAWTLCGGTLLFCSDRPHNGHDCDEA
jgi:MFS family permease